VWLGGASRFSNSRTAGVVLVSLTAGVRDQWRQNAGAAKLVMNVLKENELIFCVQKIADY